MNREREREKKAKFACTVSDSEDDGAADEQLHGDGGVDGGLAGDSPLAAEHRLPR